MIDLKEPKPHAVRPLLKKRKIPVYKVAYYIERSYAHTLRILRGHERGGPEVRAKLDKLVKHLEKKK